MRLTKRSSRRGPDRVTINLASMIDVSFLLLFYFMVATMLHDRESKLSTTLQTQNPSATGQAADFQTQNVEVRRLGARSVYRLGSREFADKGELVSALSSLPHSAGVFVKVYEGVDVGFAVAAVQAARDAGFDQVTYVPAK